MKREKKLTKRERKAEKGVGPSGSKADTQHIHCVACGRHIDPVEFTHPTTAAFVLCEHKSRFPSCLSCVHRTKELLAEHDRTGQPVKMAAAWH
jgi:hypothetical protein